MLRQVRLWNAVSNGDVGEFLYQVERYRRSGGSGASLKQYIDSRNEANGHTALTTACIGGHLSIMKYLIYYGANMEHQDLRQMTPLHHLAIHGHGSCIKFMLLICRSRAEQRELLQLRDNRGLTALDLAQVAQRDWLYMRERVNKIGSFIDKKTRVTSSIDATFRNERLDPIDVEKENDFIWAVELLSSPPHPIRSSIFQTLLEEERTKVAKKASGNVASRQTNVLSISTFRGPLAYFPINHELFTLALPDKEHQRRLANAARHSPSLRQRMEAAKTMRAVKLIVNVMKPALGIEFSRFDKYKHEQAKLKHMSLNEKRRRQVEMAAEKKEGEAMFAEDAFALKIRKFLTCDCTKLEYIQSIFKKLCKANGKLHSLQGTDATMREEDAPGVSKESDRTDSEVPEVTSYTKATTRVDELTPLFFSRFIAATGELVNSAQIKVILKTIRDLSSKEHGIWPPKSIGIVEFTIFWLIGEENASKEATKPLPRWMQHDESGKNANGAMNLTVKEAATAALPKPTWLKRLKARVLVNSKVNTVSQSTARTSIFARIMTRATLSFDEIDHVNSDMHTPAVLPYRENPNQRQSVVQRFMQLVHAPYANQRPELPKAKVKAVREKRKDEKRLKTEMQAILGTNGGDSSADKKAVEKAEKISKAQQKLREQNSAKAKEEAERQRIQKAKRDKREAREKKKKELLDKKKAKLRKAKMKEALKLENKRKRQQMKAKKSVQRGATSRGRSSGKQGKKSKKQTFTFTSRRG